MSLGEQRAFLSVVVIVVGLAALVGCGRQGQFELPDRFGFGGDYTQFGRD
jgi:hypothetical protein